MSNESKGKGKASSSQQDSDEQPRSQSTSPVTAGSSAAQTLTSALRSSMASSQLSSVMQSMGAGGKEGFQGGAVGAGGGELRDWLVQDLRAGGANGVSSGSSGVQTGGFRTGGSTVIGEEDGEKMFDDFQRGLRLNDNTSGGNVVGNEGALDQSWTTSQASTGWQSLNPAQTRPFDTYTQLDAPLHESVRNDHSHTANAPTAPRQLPHPAANALLAQSDDIFSLLDAETESSEPSQPEVPLSSAVLSNFSSTYRPPSPSHSSFSREQAAMHLSLAEAQSSTQSQRDLLIPRADNPSTLEGVYAPTPEAALSSIFATTGRDESTDVTETESIDDRGRTVIRKITKHFGASSYIDDVYGISPVLKETIEEVLKQDNTEENREKAVRRLESLWRHISNSGPQNQGADWVDGWLLKNT